MQTLLNIYIALTVLNALFYIVYTVVKFGFQKSVSMTFYELPYEPLNLHVWFRCTVGSIATMMILCGWQEPLFIISGIGLFQVTIFPRVKVGWKKVIHTIGAVIWVVSAFVGILVHYEFNNCSIMYVVGFALCIICILVIEYIERQIKKLKNTTYTHFKKKIINTSLFWIEILAMVMIVVYFLYVNNN